MSPHKCPTAGRRPASAWRDAKHSRMYARELERRAAQDAAIAAAREQQLADEMKEATFSPRTIQLPGWYRWVGPRPGPAVRGSESTPSKPAGACAAKPTQPSSRRRPIRQQPQASIERRFRGKQTATRSRRPADEAPTAGASMQAAESTPAAKLLQAVSSGASDQPLEPPSASELQQLGWGTAMLADGQRYWWMLGEPAVLYWELPPKLWISLRALRDGDVPKALATLPSSAAELDRIEASSKGPNLGSMMAALGVS